MNTLSPRAAYGLWAPTYSDETAISHLEVQLAAAMTPALAGLRLLDAGCGGGRRLRGAGAALAVGVDLSPEMLDAASAAPEPGVSFLLGDVRALPLADGAFDVVWCRLVIGHLPDCAPAYAELARVAAPGARVLVTDFHPAACAAGHRRTFRRGRDVFEIEHHVHAVSTHLAAAHAAGLQPLEIQTAKIGPQVRPFYDRAGRSQLYKEHEGLPVVLALSYRREA